MKKKKKKSQEEQQITPSIFPNIGPSNHKGTRMVKDGED